MDGMDHTRQSDSFLLTRRTSGCVLCALNVSVQPSFKLKCRKFGHCQPKQASWQSWGWENHQSAGLDTKLDIKRWWWWWWWVQLWDHCGETQRETRDFFYILTVTSSCLLLLSMHRIFNRLWLKDVLRAHGSNKKNFRFRLRASDKPTPVP